MSAQDINFLRDQVERLNALLGRYQEQYSLPLQVVCSFWLCKDWIFTLDRCHIEFFSSQILSPLMQEYDGTLQQLQGESEEQKSQMSHLRQQLEELLTENDRLRQDMKDIINQQLGSSGSTLSQTGTGVSLDPNLTASTANLQHQLRLALQEKEACQERWREASQELDRLEAELQAQKESHQWKSVEKQAQEIQDQYAQSVAALNAEMETLQSDLRQYHDDEKAEKIFKEGITDSKMAELQRIMEDLRQRLASSTRDVDDLKREKSGMEARITELTRRLADTEHRENEAIQQVRDAVAMAETSVFEKDQAELQMRHREEEVSQLHDSITKVINEAGVRTRQEVDNVRKQCNERVEKLTEELHTLELENTEKQASLDRLLREKRAVESELQKIARDGKLEGSRTKEAIEELSKRVSDAERSRDDLLMKLENMQNALDKERDENQQMKESYDAKLQSVQDRLAALQQEYDHANDDRLQHVDAINTLTKKLQQAEQEKESVHRKFLKELALIEQEQQTKTRGFEVQLQTTEDARRTSVGELRKLLNAQQRMSARWKEECHTITHKFEGKMDELRSEITHLRRRNDQLTGLLKESQTKVADAERIMSEYTRNIRRMEQRVQKAENRASDAAKQMSRHHTKERQLASERQSLLNELSRSQREK
ncbi:hypothetical protein BaRGS_00036507 [Batillaria attramentaria]|uniref:Sodium channel and clathrin linker 1 n=1 Tax=Batillaria attramentaria TaxID=370345 RepID=A0ABD0JBA5_9CAEN